MINIPLVGRPDIFSWMATRNERKTEYDSHGHLQRLTWSPATAPQGRPSLCLPREPGPASEVIIEELQKNFKVYEKKIFLNIPIFHSNFHMKYFNLLPHQFLHFLWIGRSQILQIPMFFPLHRHKEPFKKPYCEYESTNPCKLTLNLNDSLKTGSRVFLWTFVSNFLFLSGRR